MLLLICVSFVAVLSGCETVKGIAQDIQNTGDNLWEGMNK